MNDYKNSQNNINNQYNKCLMNDYKYSIVMKLARHVKVYVYNCLGVRTDMARIYVLRKKTA